MTGVEPMSGTVLIGPAVVAYGRHAAPPSAYGPSDVHRLLPVSPVAWQEVPRDGADDEPVEFDHSAPLAAVVELDPPAVVADGDGPARRAHQAAGRAAGLWSRLLHLPQVG